MTTGASIGDKSLVDLTEDKVEGLIVQDIKSGEDLNGVLRQVIYESKFDQI